MDGKSALFQKNIWCNILEFAVLLSRDWTLLLDKLKLHGFYKTVFECFNNYLPNNHSGVSQGPKLFNVDINDIVRNLTHNTFAYYI